jgi:hypothetical protein
VHYVPAGEEITIAFADLAAYRDELLTDGRELRSRLHSGKKVKLATNRFLGPIGDYEACLQAVQAALVQYNATTSALIVREKSFYEKPFATLLLLVYALMLAVGVGVMLLRHRPITGSLLTAFGLLLTYACLWYKARARHYS